MANKEAYSQLQNQLAQQMGGLLTNAPAPNTAGHEVEAVLCETIISLSRKPDGTISLFNAKPVLRATLYILETRFKELEKALAMMPANIRDNVTKEQKSIINSLKTLIDNTKGGD